MVFSVFWSFPQFMQSCSSFYMSVHVRVIRAPHLSKEFHNTFTMMQLILLYRFHHSNPQRDFKSLFLCLIHKQPFRSYLCCVMIWDFFNILILHVLSVWYVNVCIICCNSVFTLANNMMFMVCCEKKKDVFTKPWYLQSAKNYLQSK